MPNENVIDSIPVSEKPAGFVYSSNSGEIIIEFADGARPVPENIIRIAGGIDVLKELAPDLKEVNYSDFVGEFDREMAKQELNNYQRRFINSHFGKFF